MNPLLDSLQPYPFEKLRLLFKDVTPPAGLAHISFGIGEPKHPTPPLIRDAVIDSLGGLAAYPATLGSSPLRESIAKWVTQRYNLPPLDPLTEVLPVAGSREALFALAQTVLNPRRDADGEPAIVLCPNPFYQIYEGAALLGGAQPYFVNSDPARNFACDYSTVPADVWARTQLLYVCSPGNPTGAVLTLDDWRELFALSDRYGFVIASDECYSEIYFDESKPPLGGLEAAHKLGRGFERLVMLSSLSKRSNVPGMRLNLAQALMCRSDLLLLDEPTNHLDLDAIVWLEDWLNRYSGTLIVISHDREFLDSVCNVTLHLENQQIKRYGGNYSQFEVLRAQQIALQQSAYEKQQRTVAHLQSYINRFKAQATKARQAQSRVKALEKMELIAPAHVASPFTFEFRTPDSAPNPMMVMEDVRCGYHGHLRDRRAVQSAHSRHRRALSATGARADPPDHRFRRLLSRAVA